MTQPIVYQYCYNNAQALMLDPILLGGKAANLAWLTREGFCVPQWWVITTEGFQRLMEHNQLTDWIDLKIKSIADDSDPISLETIAMEIQKKLHNMQLPESLYQQLNELLEASDEHYFAVRSSVLGEDAEGASFAGQMDSYLYQKGIDAIVDSIRKVIASAFNSRALHYRISKGISLSDIRAAVIIQEMIDGEVSGVMFTANPITGNRKSALVSAAWGCGEGVVSGVCNTDEFNVGLDNNTIESRLADKDIAVVFDLKSGCGTQEVEVDDNKRKQPSLTESDIYRLRDVGRRIAECQHAPQDIEWTLRKGKFHILQTRPITRLPAPNPPLGKKIVFDNSNIQESYCGVTTPLTFSFANKAYATVYEQTMRVLGVTEQQIHDHQDMLDNMLGLINGRVYYNINNWYRGLLLLPSFNSNKSDMERMMGLTDPVDLIVDTQLTTVEKLKKMPQVSRALFHMLHGFRRMDTLVQQFRANFDTHYQSINRNTLHTLTSGELIDELHRLDKELLGNWTTPIINDFYVMMMNGRVHRTLVAAGFEQPEALQNNLMSGEEGIESTEPTKVLLQMCTLVRQRPALRQLLEDTDIANDQLLARIQTADTEFYNRCLNYIERYGDRTMGELKLESITLRQDPSFLFAVLRNYLGREDLSLASLAEKEAIFRQQAEEQAFGAIGQKLGRRTLRRFKKHLSKLRDAIRNRENMRLARTRTFGLYRDIFLEIGNQLAFYEVLIEPRDIFWLSIEEIYAWRDGRSVQTHLKPLVAARKLEYSEYDLQEPDHHFWVWDTVYLHNDYTYPHDVELTKGDLTGTGCYPGIVEEQVRLIFSPEDELSLDGQILCTVRTDPGWAPLFPTAGGILVERGSTLSHSAVVARELGIPAIVGVPGLTQILQNGELVRMNGATGSIERLDQYSEGADHAIETK